LPTIAAAEQNHSRDYASHGDAGTMPADEQSHARMLQQISKTSPDGMQGGAIARLEGRHRTPGGNALRAAVLGASDGLLSNMSLVMGVVGAEVGSRNILLTGFAGLLAGAFSMALGEWLSVQSSRELFEKQIRLEKEEIEMAPEEEIEELALIYQARGVEKNTAHQMATQIIGNRKSALDTLAREELGVDPSDLGGSAWEAAIASFLMFAIGAIIPVIPHIFLDGTIATIVSLIFSAVGLFIIGAFITLFTGRSIIYSGMRQVLFGLIAAAITFAIGRLVGVNLGG
jgi:VIT1/CCC1 family predicted Fe2+/Mn2+ transporter